LNRLDLPNYASPFSPRRDYADSASYDINANYCRIATDCKFLPGIVDVKTDLRDSIGRNILLEQITLSGKFIYLACLSSRIFRLLVILIAS